MTALVLRADARALPLPDASVDLIVTSPPYFALRSYQDAGEHYADQIGGEETPTTYIDALIECTREWMRVLKPTGSLWLNLGDKYAQDTERSRNGHGTRSTGFSGGGYLPETVQLPRRDNGVPRKSLMGLPWRYALRCIDELGLILRAEVIWSKPNGLPESVTDRVRRSHETWFHFTKAPRYFSAVDEIREAHTWGRQINPEWARARAARTDALPNKDTFGSMNPLGKLPGSVWEIATEPLTVPDHLGVNHFAAFPMEWPRRLILGWSPSGICTACGEGRRPVAERLTTTGPARATTTARDPQWQAINRASWEEGVQRTITGYACVCADTSAHTRPAVIVDPFGGTGTTALVASALGRIGITVDRSADYCRIARWRTTDPAQRAKALGVEKPAQQLPGQTDLFAHLEAA